MRKFLPILPILFFISIFTGCQIKEYTPELPISFNQKATVSTGDFAFECEICKTETKVDVTVLSTQAEGLVMSYNGQDLTFTYEDFSHAVDGKDFEPTNTAIIIYEVFESLNTTAQSKKIDGGYQHFGKITLGDYVLLQNDDNSLKSIEIRSAGIFISF